MEDEQIIELFWERSERAIGELSKKHGARCLYIAGKILRDREDAKECVNDTWLKAWNRIPPERPCVLSAFLTKITRELAIDRIRERSAKKRGGGAYEAVYEELSEWIAGENFEDKLVERIAMTDILNRFLGELSEENRRIFLQRYYYFCSIREIAAGLDIGESKVKMSLLRSRKRIRELLEREEMVL